MSACHPQRRYRRSEARGFTLIEVMVVVVIIAVISGISMLSLTQALRRPGAAQAEQLQSWLQQLADLSRLQGSAYGVREHEGMLQALVFYRQAWFPLQEPAPFRMDERLTLALPRRQAMEDTDSILPQLVLAEGRWEPAATLLLQDDEQETAYALRWDAATAAVELARGER